MDLLQLQDLLIVSNREYTEAELTGFDTIYAKYPIRGIDIAYNKHICHYHGDITELHVDAVVNPANSNGLGCFVREHKCLDNIIHRRAGPRLRAQCRAFLHGNTLPTGKIMITHGFHLPAKYIIHIPGPIWDGIFDQEALQRCYRNILKVSNYAGYRSIAIPCISTGLYGYPQDDSAKCAVQTVLDWYQTHPDSQILTIFCTYDDMNKIAYERALLTHA